MKLTHLLTETSAFMPPVQLLEELSPSVSAQKTGSIPHSIIEILAHMDFWQSWFLHRCRGEAEPMAESAAVGWPAVTEAEWEPLKARFLQGLQEAAAYSDNPSRLSQPIQPAIEFPAMSDFTLGDALVHLAVHNAHHFGQIVTLRQALGVWPPPSGSYTW